MKCVSVRFILVIIFLCVTSSLKGNAQGIMTPSGHGLWGNTILVGGGGTYPQVYTDQADALGAIGVGFGNPRKNVGIQSQLYVADVSDVDVFSFGFEIHRRLSSGTSIAVGGQNLFPFSNDLTFDSDLGDSPPSFYLVLTHHLRFDLPYGHPLGKLGFNVGIGSGRYSEKSPRDEAAGRGENGTYVFASVSYELASWLRYNVEWSGVNLHTGLSGSLPLGQFPLGVGFSIGAADLTRYSGDQVRFIGGLAIAYRID